MQLSQCSHGNVSQRCSQRRVHPGVPQPSGHRHAATSIPLVLSATAPLAHQARRSHVVLAAAPPAPASSEETDAGASTSPDVQGPSFSDLGIDPALLAALERLEFTRPSGIQAAGIPVVLGGSNVALQSYTGSGKTLAYMLPVLTMALGRAERIYREGGGREVPVQAVIVAPSQELAMQVVRVTQSLLPHEGRTMVQQCIGGANPRNQLAALERNKPIIVVGTPGRLAELMRTGALRVHKTPLLVLDEADQLLAPQFAEDMAQVAANVGKRLTQLPAHTNTVESGDSSSIDAAYLPATRQTITVSATLSETVLEQLQKWCPDPVYVTAEGAAPVFQPSEDQGAESSDSEQGPGWGWGVRGWDGPASSVRVRGQGSAGGVEGEGLVPTMPPQLQHYYMVTPARRKVDTLRRTVHALGFKRVLAFMNFQQRTQDTRFKLEARGMSVAVLHGEMPKVARQNVLADFKKGKVRVLVVSDVMARGLDVPNCDAVVNLELPSSASHYAHRAGRTGRMGAPGTVISLAEPRDVWVVRDKLADKLGVEIKEAHVSSGELQMGAPERLDSDSDEDDSNTDVRQTNNRDASRDQRRTKGPAAATLAATTTQHGERRRGTGRDVPIDADAVASGSGRDGDSTGSKAGSRDAQTSASVRRGFESAPEPSPARDAEDSLAAAPSSSGNSKVGRKGTGGGTRVERDRAGQYENVIYDDEDEIDLLPDEEQDLEAQLEALKEEACKKQKKGKRRQPVRSKVGAGSGGESGGEGTPEFLKGGVRGRGVKGGDRDSEGGVSDVRRELAAELDELKREREAMRGARRAKDAR